MGSAKKLDGKDESALVEKLKNLRPFAQELRESLKCAICLDCIEDAQQLKCGHVFCMTCVQGTLKMKYKKGGPRCAMCKAEVTRRNFRPAPIDYSVLVESLLGIEEVLDKHAPEPKRTASQPTGPLKKINDGFDAETKAEAAKRRRDSSPPSTNLESIDPIPTIDIRTSPTTPSPRHRRIICSLCPALEGHDGERPDLGPFRPIAGSSRKVHENCAKFANDIVASDDNVFYHVAHAITNSTQVHCSYSRCQGIRATVSCAAERCSRKYHYECAVYDGAQLIDDECKLYCSKHCNADAGDTSARNIIVQTNATVDPNESNSNVCYLCKNVGHLVMCDFCDNSVHLECANLRRAPKGAFKCTVCKSKPATPVETSGGPAGTAEEPCSQDSGSLVSVQEVSPPRPSPVRPKRKKSTPAATGRKSPTSKRARRTTITGAGDGSKGKQGYSQGVLSKKYVLSMTGLDETQKALVTGVAGIKRTAVKSDFNPKITHMICNAFEPEDTPTRTMKLCKAIASGMQIICYKWIEDSVGWHGPWKDVGEHVHPLTRQDRNLFQGLSFYFGDLGKLSNNKDDLITIIKLGNGTVLTEKPRVSVTPTVSKLYLVEDQSPSPSNRASQRKRGGRRASLADLVHDIPGDVEIVSPTWILDRCTTRNDGTT